MAQSSPGEIRLLLIGAPGSEFRLAAGMARDAGAEVVTADSITAALATMRAQGADLALIDVSADIESFIAQLRRERMALPVYACGVDAPAARAVAAIRAGARDYLPLPPDRDLIAAAIISVAGNARELIGNHPELTRTITLGLTLASARAPLLIVGEPGTGRELLARNIHAAVGKRGRFIAVNCADIDPAMIESEIFGHAAGAFPGAVADRSGRLEAAAEGTLFLGEVAMLPLTAQARLALYLNKEARLNPGQSTQARIIASTAFNLDARVSESRFRASLLDQLGLFRLAMPSLRDRADDIPKLAEYFARNFARANDLPERHFTDAAMAMLCEHDWPGNVRELEDVVHRAVLINHDAFIAASAIMLADGRGLNRRSSSQIASIAGLSNCLPKGLDGLVGSTVEDVERVLILETLKACRGNRTSASTILGISVRTMRNKLKTFVEAGMSIAPTQ